MIMRYKKRAHPNLRAISNSLSSLSSQDLSSSSMDHLYFGAGDRDRTDDSFVGNEVLYH